MLIYTWLLLPVVAGMGTLEAWQPITLFGGVLLTLLFIRHAWRLCHSGTPERAIAMFKFSILYLFALFTLPLLDKLVDKLPVVAS